jgi:hypothetical protein
MAQISTKEVERRLGEQYAQALKDNPQFTDVYKDCEGVIHSTLSVMEHYNRVTLAIQSMERRRGGAFARR